MSESKQERHVATVVGKNPDGTFYIGRKPLKSADEPPSEDEFMRCKFVPKVICDNVFIKVMVDLHFKDHVLPYFLRDEMGMDFGDFTIPAGTEIAAELTYDDNNEYNVEVMPLVLPILDKYAGASFKTNKGNIEILRQIEEQ